MKENSKSGSGKISLHGNGMGVPSPEIVEARAREIAMIDERDPENFTDADWEQARRELHGGVVPQPPEENEGTLKLEEEWEITPDNRGHRVPRPGVDEDEESLGEQLVSDGNEEASHDQMLEARKEEIEQEGGII
jgi:hypothetical protein